MYVTVSSVALATIRDHVAADPTREACGLLLGRDGEVMEARPCRNVAPEPERRFEIDPSELLAAHRSAREGAAAVLGHYHSHPSGSALPSQRDAETAPADGALWLIVGAEEARLWRAVDGGTIEGRFDPVPCAVDAAVPEGGG